MEPVHVAQLQGYFGGEHKPKTERMPSIHTMVNDGTPNSSPPTGTLVFVGLSLAVSTLQAVTSVDEWVKGLGVVPSSIARFALFERAPGQWVPTAAACVTWLFPHGGWWHVLPNMTALLLFGLIAEKRVGTVRWVSAYLGIGALSAFALGWVLPDSNKAAAGASCAISGVVGLYAAECLTTGPRRRIAGRLIVTAELLVVGAVAAWLASPHATLTPGLPESLMYHFFPLLGGWFAGRLRGPTPGTTTLRGEPTEERPSECAEGEGP